MIPVSNILRANLEPREKLNILCFFLDGKFEENLVATGHNIYGAKESYISSTPVECPGLKILPINVYHIPKYITFDLILFNHIESQGGKAERLSQIYHVPKLGVQHFIRPPSLLKPSKANFELVFVHEAIKTSFGLDGDVIPYGIEDSGVSTEERDIDVLVHGDFMRNDYRILQFAQQLQFKVEIYGNNPGLSKPIDKDELVKKLKRSKVFLNLSTHNGVPHSALLAMMNGCAIVSNINELTSKLFDKSYSTLVKDVNEFAPSINKMLDGKWVEAGKLAREYAYNNFNKDFVVKTWEAKLRAKSNEVYYR